MGSSGKHLNAWFALNSFALQGEAQRGISVAAIAAAVNVTTRTVRNWLRATSWPRQARVADYGPIRAATAEDVVRTRRALRFVGLRAYRFLHLSSGYHIVRRLTNVFGERSKRIRRRSIIRRVNRQIGWLREGKASKHMAELRAQTSVQLGRGERGFEGSCNACDAAERVGQGRGMAEPAPRIWMRLSGHVFSRPRNRQGGGSSATQHSRAARRGSGDF